MNVLRSHDGHHSNGHMYSKSTGASQRIFQILDNRSKRLLVSWPDGYDDNQSSSSAYQKLITSSLFDTKSKSDTAMKSLDTLQDSGLTCIQKTCINSCTSYLCGTMLKTVERVLITYGNIVFGLFRLSDSKSAISPTVQDESTRIPSISTITMSIPNTKSISSTTVNLSKQSTISLNNHTETTCTESHPVKNPSATRNNQIPETSKAVVTGKEVMSTQISNLQPDYTHSNLLIPYARRMCNLPELSPISESPNTRNFASRPSESYFRSNQPKNPSSIHSCESCATDSSPEWRRGPSGHKTLCNACGLRYARSLARQTKAIQQQETLNGESATIEDQISTQKRPLSEPHPPLLPPPYFRQQTHHTLSLVTNQPFPPKLSTLSNLGDASVQQLPSRARENSDTPEHFAPVHF
ncbi:hypothetical protein INT43_003642 [Umbelopsis isabellina]|uniref:GATA-type domain-containing protein n=1 Tax=Mortierella isabellina TaxID=91625 RepID=A0A8H7UBV7_MORIS|nr:hypothetical protein INT43_003642 [Umbelopsis isabellina]